MEKRYCRNTIIWIYIFLLLPLYSYAGFRLLTIDSNSIDYIGYYNTIAIDSNNKIHITYYDTTNQDLKYITNVSGLWVSTILDSIGNVGLYSSIAIDHNDKIHIGYMDFITLSSKGAFKYATNVSGSWVCTTLDNTGYVGEGISIAIDNNNKVHISYSYWDGAKYNLKYATNVSGSWVYTTLDDTTHTGGATSIAIDNNNKVHISYTTVYNGSLRYATNASGTWIFTNLSSSCNDLSGEIAIDNNNKVHIVYSNNSYLKYATNVSGSWVYSSLGYGGQFPSIAIDSNNKVHISDQGRWYITNVSGSWVRANVDSSDAGNNSHSSIVIDSNNKIHISYYAPGKKGLKLAEPNISPVLLWTGETNYTIDGMNPDVVKQGENVTFRIKYSDVDEDVPASGYPKVHIKKGTSEVVVYPMTYVSGDYNTGAIYTCTFALSLSAGEDYSYYFEAKDEWQDVAENTQEKVFTIKGVSYGVLTGRITKVYGDGTTGVGNATVQILQNGVLKAETKTDGSGNYTFTNTAIGKYDVLVSAIGYSISMQTGKEVKEAQTTVVNFTLSEGINTIITSDDNETKITTSDTNNDIYFTFIKREDITDGIGYELIMKDKNSNAKLENFSKPVTLTIHWTVANGKVANTEVSEYEAIDKLAIYYYDGVRWQKVGGLVDPVEQTVSVNTSKAGVYAIKSSAAISYGGKILVYPNPFTPNNDGVNDSVGFYFDAGTVQPVIKVYNGSGRVVRTLDGVVSWDGKDDSGSVVEAGLYLYHFRLGDLNKTGTVVVAK